ncbi:MAG: thioredoxin domain-containing protein [Deltaproteobacteria bacterium]|nr:thioredoxin domain-containing protein [Deltaproteobacteria bacterium]
MTKLRVGVLGCLVAFCVVDASSAEEDAGAMPAAPPARRAPPPLPDEVQDVEVASWNPTRGPADAPVTVVVFGEYLCPFCKKLQVTLDRLVEAYGDRVRIVWRQWIVHPPAREAALAAIAAGMQDRFWEFHDLLFERQNELRVLYEGGTVPWRDWAAEAGLDAERFERDRTGLQAEARLEADEVEARRVGATGTPSPFVNGRHMPGAVPPSWFGLWIDELLGIEGPTLPVSQDPASPPSAGCGVPTPAPSDR